MIKKDYDAIVIGSGPNGLAAAITIQQTGRSVLLIEAKDTIGGGLRSAEFTLPGFVHDVCSAVHPLAIASPFFSTLPLSAFGLEYIQPDLPAAHPLDNGRVAILSRSLEETADRLGTDKQAYLKLYKPLIEKWPLIKPDVLAPLHLPKHPVDMALFGRHALSAASQLVRRFHTEEAKALFGGMAAHSIQPLTNLTTAAIALVLTIAGHTSGWPVAKGGSQSIANALAAYFVSLGGKIQANFHVRSLKDLPSSHAVLFDTGPQQLLEIAGHQFSSLYKWQLKKYRYGPGVFKMDFALDGPIPFTSPECLRAGTIHIGGTFEEIAHGEKTVWEGRHAGKPFVLLAQQSLFDSSRSPQGKHTAWAYCHVPQDSTKDMSSIIEQQIERFAPGFKERIIAKHSINTEEFHDYNPNYIGGDIGGGVIDIGQLFTRPALRWSPYRTSAKGLYICSSSTPPGGGVHGMCGYHAAKRALKDIFKQKEKT